MGVRAGSPVLKGPGAREAVHAPSIMLSELGRGAPGIQVRKGRGCLFTLPGFPTAGCSVSMGLAYPEVIQTAVALMTGAGKHTWRAMKILYGSKV